MQVAKNLSLTKKRREPDVRGVRVPDLDKLCPSCKVEGRGDHITFAYSMTVNGRSFDVHWCPFQQREVE